MKFRTVPVITGATPAAAKSTPALQCLTCLFVYPGITEPNLRAIHQCRNEPARTTDVITHEAAPWRRQTAQANRKDVG